MRLVSFADDDPLVARGVRRVLSAPNGDLLDDQIRPAEIVIITEGSLCPSTVVRVGFDPGDIERLTETGEFFLAFLGQGMLPTAVLHREEI